MASVSPRASHRSVVITGSSTGIGRACALYLAGRGWRVFAGVRREKDGRALVEAAGGVGAGIVPLILDVTNTAAIAAARDLVSGQVGDDGLDALVNNAGIVVAGPVEAVSLADWRRQFEVNLFGQIAVTQAFLPVLRAKGTRTDDGADGGNGGLPAPHRARIVMMSSISGRVAYPALGPYAASKHALEAVSDSLRLEVMRLGVGVTLVEPGSIDTPIWRKGEEAARGAERGGVTAVYAGVVGAMERAMGRSAAGAIPAQRVAEVVEQCLTARRAPARVIVGRGSRTTARLRAWLPTGWFDALVVRKTGV